MRRSETTPEKTSPVVRLARPAAALLSALAVFTSVIWICGDSLLGRAWSDFLLNEGMLLSGREAPAAPAPVTVAVPDLTGRPFAADMLPADDFTLDVTYVYDDAPPRTVLLQSPAAGSLRKAVPGSRPVPLSLTVSAGPRTVTVPDVQGADGRAAGITLTEASFSLVTVPLTPRSPGVLTAPDGQRFRYVPRGTWTSRDLSDLEPGTALFTEPSAGTPIPVGSAVTLYVLEMPPAASPVCPSLTGLSVDAARALLAARGIAVGYIDVTVTDEAADGTVLSQSRLPGTHLSPDDAVDLVIAAAPVAQTPFDPRHFWHQNNLQI